MLGYLLPVLYSTQLCSIGKARAIRKKSHFKKRVGTLIVELLSDFFAPAFHCMCCVYVCMCAKFG